jgi:hypothetical protein
MYADHPAGSTLSGERSTSNRRMIAFLAQGIKNKEFKKTK